MFSTLLYSLTVKTITLIYSEYLHFLSRIPSRSNCYIGYLGNRQKKANALIEASGLRMIAVEDFDKAAQTVSNLLFP